MSRSSKKNWWDTELVEPLMHYQHKEDTSVIKLILLTKDRQE